MAQQPVPVDDVFDVQLNGGHDDPEHVPQQGGGQGQRQNDARPRPGAVGGAGRRGLFSHSLYCTVRSVPAICIRVSNLRPVPSISCCLILGPEPRNGCLLDSREPQNWIHSWISLEGISRS